MFEFIKKAKIPWSKKRKFSEDAKDIIEQLLIKFSCCPKVG